MAPLLILALGLVVRVPPWLAGFPLHPDEALYGAWGRAIATGADPLLLSAWVDKPPFVIYLIAGSLGLFGASPFALRLPGMIAGALLPAAVYACAAPLAGRRSALVAAALAAFSPFAVLFAPAALTDGWLTLWLLLAGAAALRGRASLAGFLAGLALASKQQGLLAPALALPWLFLAYPSSGTRRRRVLLFFRFLLPLLVVAGLVTWWDSARWAVRPSFWDRSIVTYGGIWLLPPAVWPERLARWAEPFGYTFGHPLLSLTVLSLAGRTGWRAWSRRGSIANQGQMRSLAVFVLAYATGHVVFSVQPWDRYLLPLVSLLAILAAPDIVRLAARLRVVARPVAALAVALLLVWWVLQGANGWIPVGTNYSGARGAAEVAGALLAEPPDTLLYHRSLGWHLDFYLFGVPQTARWYGDPDQMAIAAADTAAWEPERRQLLAVPVGDDTAASAERAALVVRGLALQPLRIVADSHGRAAFELYLVGSMAR